MLFPSVNFRYFGFILALILHSGLSGYALIEYKKGSYFKGNERVDGYVYFAFDNYESFFFKKELSGASRKMKLVDCDSFTIEDRKFVKLSRLTLKAGLSSRPPVQAFAEHVIEGPVNLYKVYSSTNAAYSRGGVALNKEAGKLTSVFLEKDNNRLYVPANKDPLKFQGSLAGLFADRSDLVEKINSGYFKLNNIEELVTDYNRHR